MKKGFFTSSAFRIFIAFSIALGVFLVPISFLREKTSTGGVSYIHIQKASADAVNTRRGLWWNKDKCYDTQTDAQVDCESGNTVKGGGFFSGLLEIILAAIAYIFLAVRALAALLLTISAWVLDQSLKATIGFDYSQIGGVLDVWKIVRDSFNVLFVFILLWAGITQIIGIAKTNTKQIIIGVVIAGLLINFSMFFARVLIDVSNMTSTSLYNQIVSTSGSATSNFSLSSGLTQGLGVAAITITNSNAFTADWNNGNSEIGKASGVLNTFQIILLFVMQIAVYLIAAFAFISVCILFIGRIVMLTLLLALSPIGFLGTSAIGGVLSKVRDASKWWWDEFSAQLFVTPIFLLLIFITIKVANGVGSTEMNSILEAMKGDSIKSVDFTMFLKFGIVIFLILKTVEITKKSSGSVGQSINSFGSKAVGFGLGVATGGGAMLARRTIGAGLSNIAKGNNRVGNFLQERKAKGSIMANIALRGAEKGAKTSFDIRNTELGKSMVKKSGIDANANIPEFMKAKKGGYDQAQKDFEKGQTESAEKLKTGEFAKQEIRNKIWEEKVTTATKIAGMEAPSGDIMLDQEKKTKKSEIGALELNSKGFKNKDKEIKEKAKEIEEKLASAETTEAEKALARRDKRLNDYEQLVMRHKELNTKDENGVVGGKAIKNKEKETYEMRAKDYAEAREKSILTRLSRGKQGRKDAANAIREKIKSKTKEQKAVDAIKEMKDETEKESEKEKSEAPIASKPASPPSEPKTT